MRARHAMALVLLIACGKDKAVATTDASTWASTAAIASGKPKPPWPADAPDPNAACTKHEDCTVLMHDAILPPDPCCEQRVGFLPVTRKYAEFTSNMRAQCAGVKCPTSPLPGPEPSCCASIGRCVNKKCILGCDDPTLDAPKVVWHDAPCTSMR